MISVEVIRVPLVIILLLLLLLLQLLELQLTPILLAVEPWIGSKVRVPIRSIIGRQVGVEGLLVRIRFRCNPLRVRGKLDGRALGVHSRRLWRRGRRIHLPSIIEAKETSDSLNETRFLDSMRQQIRLDVLPDGLSLRGRCQVLLWRLVLLIGIRSCGRGGIDLGVDYPDDICDAKKQQQED